MEFIDKGKKVGNKVRLMSGCHYKSLLSGRNVPILFIIVCFLIIANSSCDQVGSTNDEMAIEKEKTITTDSTTKTTKLDPLSMLREIYLDQNSKIITMISPEVSDQVQKFHPNGRYGRRSVNNLAEPHSELGKLNEGRTLRSILRSFEPLQAAQFQSRDLNANNRLLQTNNNQDPGAKIFNTERTIRASLFDRGLDSDSELSKLLNCNYSGISNLYWCDNGN